MLVVKWKLQVGFQGIKVGKLSRRTVTITLARDVVQVPSRTAPHGFQLQTLTIQFSRDLLGLRKGRSSSGSYHTPPCISLGTPRASISAALE